MKKANRPTVLLACGDAKQRRLCAKALAASACRVVEHGDGQEALAFLRQQTPDLMILDANLPSLGGTELCCRAKRVAQLKDVPVIILAFASDDAALARAARCKAERVLTKPLKLEAVLAAAEDLLGNVGR